MTKVVFFEVFPNPDEGSKDKECCSVKSVKLFVSTGAVQVGDYWSVSSVKSNKKCPKKTSHWHLFYQRDEINPAVMVG